MSDTHHRPFADWLIEQQSGRTHGELTDALAELVAAVRETGKKGTLTLVIAVAPFDKGNGAALTVTDTIKRAVPQHDRRKSIFYADDAGNLTKDDPMQPTFESLREVPAPATAAVRTIGQEKHA